MGERFPPVTALVTVGFSVDWRGKPAATESAGGASIADSAMGAANQFSPECAWRIGDAKSGNAGRRRRVDGVFANDPLARGGTLVRAWT